MALDLLCSYAFHKRTDLAKLHEALSARGGKLMIDSGAFSAYNSGTVITVHEYASFLRRWEGAYDYAFTLDVIGNQGATARNFARLRDAGLAVLPIYTARAPVADLDALAGEHDYIGLGGMVGVPRHYALPATRSITERAAARGCRVHTLGQIGLDVFTTSVAYSGDSAAASKIGRLGIVGVYDPATRDYIKVQVRERDAWRKHGDLLAAYGLDARACLSGEDTRSITGTGRRIFRAAVLALMLMSDVLQAERGADHPRLYTAVAHADVLRAAYQLMDEGEDAVPRLLRGKVAT